MERVHHPPLSRSSKMERRIVEKNRRNQMKSLYSKLNSLLPDNIAKEFLPVPDQIEEAEKYIKSLQDRVEKCKEKKEKLLRNKRSHSCITSETSNTKSSKLPQFEIHETGPAMDVILINGLENQALFYGILRLLREEGFEVVNASFSVSGNSMLQVFHQKVGKSTISVRATAVTRRLKELFCGSQQHDELESRLDFWNFNSEPDVWGSEILEIITMPRVGEFSILNRI